MEQHKGLVIALVLFTAGITMFSAALHRWIVPMSTNGIWQHTSATHIDSILDSDIPKRTTVQELSKRKIQLTDLSAKLTNGFAKPQDLSQLIQIVYDAAWKVNREGLRFTRTQPQPETIESDRISYPVLFDISADYSSFCRFIYELEKIPRIVHVDGIAMKGTQRGQIDATIAITGFVSKGSK